MEQKKLHSHQKEKNFYNNRYWHKNQLKTKSQ